VLKQFLNMPPHDSIARFVCSLVSPLFFQLQNAQWAPFTSWPKNASWWGFEQQNDNFNLC